MHAGFRFLISFIGFVFFEEEIIGGTRVRGHGGTRLPHPINNYCCLLILSCNDFFSAIRVIDILDAVFSRKENCSSFM